MGAQLLAAVPCLHAALDLLSSYAMHTAPSPTQPFLLPQEQEVFIMPGPLRGFSSLLPTAWASHLLQSSCKLLLAECLTQAVVPGISRAALALPDVPIGP